MIVTLRGQQRKLFDLKDLHVSLIYVQLSEVFYILTTTMLSEFWHLECILCII